MRFKSYWYKFILDFIVAIFLIVLLCPIYILISIIIKITSRGRVFYLGERAGRYGKNFKIFKFRTMVENADQIGGFSTAKNDHRLTKVGKWLRKYKLDELPQLFNVILGDMSIVGPRPQVLFYTSKYSGEESIILSARPGITDLASLYFIDMDSVLGETNVDDKYYLEIEPIKNLLRIRYVRECSISLDLRIIIETIFGLFGIHNITKLNIKF